MLNLIVSPINSRLLYYQGICQARLFLFDEMECRDNWHIENYSNQMHITFCAGEAILAMPHWIGDNGVSFGIASGRAIWRKQ